MLIPELVNSRLKKDIFIKKFENLITNTKENIIQIKESNRVIKKIEMKKPPFKIAFDSIKKFL